MIPESARSETSGDETGARGDSGESRSSEGRSRDARDTGKAAGQRSQWVFGTHTIAIAVLSAVTAILVSVGATFGGSLVYEYGFNVETAGDHPAWHKSEEDVLPGEHD